MKCTFKELELQNGEVIQLTLNFTRLLQLKSKRENLYNRYNLIYNKPVKDNTFDTIAILYIAYLCANIDEIDTGNLMSESEFMEEIPQSFALINDIVAELTKPKLKKNLETHLEKQQEK